MLGVDGKVVQVHYKVCAQIERKEKLLILYGNMLDIAKPWYLCQMLRQGNIIS